MKIIISPAKTLKLSKVKYCGKLPRWSDKSKLIHQELLKKSIEELMQLMKVSEKIASSVYTWIHTMCFNDCGYQAIATYDGIQYKALAYDTLTEQSKIYLQQHLWILSGMYGVVCANDCIEPYRLEMQIPLHVENYPNLYAFWQSIIKDDVKDEIVINLASKEYEKLLRPLVNSANWYDVIFYQMKQGKYVAQSTQVKKARGLMLRYLAQQQIINIQQLQQFKEDGYTYDESQSSEHCLVFVKG